MYTYWLKKIAIKEEHEPVVIDLASETDYSSDDDTASKTEDNEINESES